MSTELVTLNDEQYPALADGGAILRTIKQNLGNDEISPSDLTRIKVPLGGSETWLVPGIGGETAHKTLALEGDVALNRTQWLEVQSNKWKPIWFYPSIGLFAIVALFALAFRDKPDEQETPR